MPVTCPHCSTRYVLPEALLGPGGARVRCPRCREPFAVGSDGIAPPPPPPTHAAVDPVAALAASPPADEARESAAFDAHAGNGATTAVAIAAMPVELRTAGPPRLPSAPSVAVPARAGGGTDPLSAAETPSTIANEVLEELAAHSGDAIAASRAQGRLFQEFGPVIAEAFEFYRRRVGPPADPAPFRAALRERWGVDLEAGNPPKRLI